MDSTNLVNAKNNRDNFRSLESDVKNPTKETRVDSSDLTLVESKNNNLDILEKSLESRNNSRELRISDTSAEQGQRKVEIREQDVTPDLIKTQNTRHLHPEKTGGKSDVSNQTHKFWPWSPYVKKSKSTFIEQLTENVNSRLAKSYEVGTDSNDINIPIGKSAQTDDYYQPIDICENECAVENSQKMPTLVTTGALHATPKTEFSIGALHAPPKTEFSIGALHAPPNTPANEMSNVLPEIDNRGLKRRPNSALNKSTDSGRSTPLAKKVKKEAATLTFLDIPFHQTSSEMTGTEKDLLILIMAKAGGAKQYHQKKMSTCKFYNKLLGILSQILSILAGSTGIGALITSTSSGLVSVVALAVVTVITLIAAIFATLQRGFGFENGAISHKQSCIEYSHIVTKIARFLATPDLDRKDIEIFTNNIVLELGVAESNED